MKTLPYILSVAGMLLSSYSMAAPQDFPTKIRIGYQKGGSLVLLKSSGELEKSLAAEHVGVEWDEFSVGPPLVEALNAGAIDIGYVGAPPPIFAQAGAAPSVVYVGYGQPATKGYGIVVKNSSPIKDFQDLKGKRIGVVKGSAGEYFLLQALNKYHIPLSDIQEIYLDYSAGRAAWERGDIDAWLAPDPRLADVEINSNARTVLTAADVAPQYNFYISPASFAQHYPKAVNAVLSALNNIEKKVEANPEPAANILSQDTRIPVAVWERTLKRQSWGVAWPLTDEVIASQQNVADLFYRYHMIPKAVDVKEIVAHLAVSSPDAK